MEHLSGHALYGVLLIAYGLVTIFFPVVGYFFDRDWGYRDLGSSPSFDFLIRLQGVAAVVIGVVVLRDSASQVSHSFLPF